MHGYCSDITRMFVVGEPTRRGARRLRACSLEAQERAVAGRDGRHVRARRSTRPRAA